MKNKILALRKNQMYKDSFWGLLGNVVGKGLSFVAAILIARFLGKELYGEYGIIRSTLLSIAVFSTFGLGYSSTKYVADYANKDKEAMSKIVVVALNITYVFSALMALFICVFSYDIAILLKAPHLDFYLKVLSVIVFFNAITTTQIGILAGLKMFKAIAANNTYSGLVTFFLSVFFAYFWEFKGAVGALLIAQVFNCIINWYSLRSVVKLDFIVFKWRDYKLYYNELIKFSFPIALQESLYSFSNWVGVFLLVYFGDYGDVGINSVVLQWTNIILFVPGVLRNIALSYFSSSVDNEVEHKTVLKNMIRINLTVTIIPFAVVLLFGKYIVLFYGESFEGVQSVLNLAVFSTIFNCVSTVYLNELISRGKNWLVFNLRLFREFTTILLSLIFFIVLRHQAAPVLLYNIAFTLSMIIFFFVLKIYTVKNNKL